MNALYIQQITHFIGQEWKQCACLVPLPDMNILYKVWQKNQYD